jgi:hypothetical protein
MLLIGFSGLDLCHSLSGRTMRGSMLGIGIGATHHQRIETNSRDARSTNPPLEYAWSPFEDLITLPDRRNLSTLRDAGDSLRATGKRGPSIGRL